ncbi:BppU family phage baseplate upper protein, partial [Lactococcus lactis]|uniref:BppU family phage baseplate upper protein n=1 Tax=Lactococcus lactis TaxID=1358 RepID=UPI00288D5D51
MSDYSITLSTTEPNNYVGLIKLRQGDVASQSIQATITANGQLFKFDRLSVFFNAVLPNGNVIRDKVTNVDYVNSKLNYVVADSFLQEVAQVTAWFSFENDEKIIDSTKNFQYSVIGGWKECIPQGNYIYELSEIQREIEQIIGNKDFSKLLLKIDSIKNEYNYINQVKADKTELNKTNEEIWKLEATTSTLDNKVSTLSSGAPKAVSNVSGMIDKTKNYVYTGTEQGYVA